MWQRNAKALINFLLLIKETLIISDQLTIKKRDYSTLQTELENKNAIIHDLKIALLSPDPTETPHTTRTHKMGDELQQEIDKTKIELEAYEKQIASRYSRTPSVMSQRVSNHLSEGQGVSRDMSRRDEGETLDTLAFLYKNDE